MKHRVVDHIVGALAAHGVGHVFGVDGANIEDLFDALHQNLSVAGVLAKHEFSAATMADGYARASASLGVMIATSGGGSLNLIAGLGESLASGTPVLALVGQPPTTLDGHGSFQDTSGVGGSLDAVALFSAVSRYCRRLTSAEDVVSALPEAVAAAQQGGPAVLLLPKDVQQGLIDVTRSVALPDERRSHGDLGPLVEEMRGAGGRVVLIAGKQVARDGARTELEALQRVLGAVVATEPDAKDVADTGLVTGVMGHPDIATAIAESGVCLLVGARLPATACAGLDDALRSTTVVSIGAEPPYVNASHVPSDDLRRSLTRLAEGVQGRAPREPKPLPPSVMHPPAHDGPGLRYGDAMAAVDNLLPNGADIVVDAGNCGAAAIHRLRVRRDGRFLVALGMGGMGYAFGAAIGTCFARRRRTVVLAGDGSFFMHGMELHTAIQYRLPITAILFNNNAHAMCVTREKLYYGGGYSFNRFDPSRLGAGLAAMFPGLPSVDVDQVDALPDALRSALAHDGPAVVCVECSADEIPPFATFLAALESKESHVPARA